MSNWANATNDIQRWVKQYLAGFTSKVINREGGLILPPGGPLGDGYPARPHADTHAYPGGSDALDPASIGAATEADLDTEIADRIAGDTASRAPKFVTTEATGTLPNERVITAGANISITDGGAGGNLTIAATGVTTGGPYVPLAGSVTVTGRTDFGTFAAPLSTVAGVFYGVNKGVQAQAVGDDPDAAGVVGQGITGVVGQADDGAGSDVGEVGVGVQGYGEVGVEGLGYGVGGAGIKGVGQAGSLAARFSGGAVRIDLPVGIKLEVYADGGLTPVATIDEAGKIMAVAAAVTATGGDYGVYATAESGTALEGVSASGEGMHAESTSGIGLKAQTDTGTALKIATKDAAGTLLEMTNSSGQNVLRVKDDSSFESETLQAEEGSPGAATHYVPITLNDVLYHLPLVQP